MALLASCFSLLAGCLLRPQLRKIIRDSLVIEPDRIDFIVTALDEPAGGGEVGRRIDRTAGVVGAIRGIPPITRVVHPVVDTPDGGATRDSGTAGGSVGPAGFAGRA